MGLSLLFLLYLGMDRILIEQQRQDLANEFGMDLPTLKTVYNIESSGSGFDKTTNKIKIQFEPTVMSNRLLKKGIAHSIKTVFAVDKNNKPIKEYELTAKGVTLINGVEGQQSEYIDLELAKKIDIEIALESTSWGFNYKLAGYTSAEEMINSFLISEYNQLKGMLTFIKNVPNMLHYLQIHNWAGFADLYNGHSYKIYNYDVRLENEYIRITGHGR